MRVVRELREISADLSLTFEDRLARLLTMGCRLLGLELGILSHIENDLYTIIEAVNHSSDTVIHALPSGTEFALGDTYCADTLHANDIVAYHNIDDHPGTLHPCYHKFPLRSYIAIPIYVNQSCYGTLNFSSTTAHDGAFTDLDFDYLILLAEWVGTEISRQLAMEMLLNNQRQLSEQNALFRQVNELTGVGTWQVNMLSGEVNWSPSLKQIFGLAEDASITTEQVLAFIKDPQTQEYYHHTFVEKSLKGEDWTYEFEVITANGETRWVETRCHPLLEQGKCVRVIGATQEVTERVLTNRKLTKESELAAEALAARSLFLANMSHEIRTPIHGVQGMLEALSNTAMTDQQREYCGIAKHSAESLLGIVNDVLDFSKIDAGRMQFVNRPLNISSVVKQQLSLFRQVLEQKQLTLSLDIAGTDKMSVMGDSTRIAQIVINLISNAIKFTNEGEISVATRCLAQPDGKYLVRLRVTDTGIGIAPHRQYSIFKPFEQAESTIASQFGGTGLGLSIVAEIARHYNGGVHVESEQGQGACFTVTLQLPAVQSAELPSYGQRRRRSDHIQWGNVTVLVVEDNEVNQAVLRAQLSTLGLAAEFANNGEQGVNCITTSLASGRHYDIVLMDCQMPVMDGYQATRSIRDLGAVTQALPIIALTANAMPDAREKCLAAGMNDYLTKPLTIERLVACLRQYLVLPPQSA